MNFRRFIEDEAATPFLHIDSWDVFGQRSLVLDRQTINFAELRKGSCTKSAFLDSLREAGGRPSERGSRFRFFNSAPSEDCKLLALLEEFYPTNPKNQRVVETFKRSSPDLFKVLYWDFPGESPKTWLGVYTDPQTGALRREFEEYRHAFVHPFIHEVPAVGTAAGGYELILQYWLFYPFNDGGNNHEGDWEHINVVVSPLGTLQRAQTEEEIQALLAGTWVGATEREHQLVLKRVEYYFHYQVMLVDFTRPNAYAPRADWRREVDRLSPTAERLNERKIWQLIREMAFRDTVERQINTHPLGYIGADNKGLDQALGMPGATNRDSHGTYPFPGIFKNIGPAGASERIPTQIDIKKLWTTLDEHGDPPGPLKRGHVVSLARPERLEIVPDWERVADLAADNADVRRTWSWLLLPIHWGYPASVSPFAGVLKHVDTGNRPPVTPSWAFGWNVSGASAGYALWEPHRMTSLFPTGLNDSFNNSLGFLNFTYPVLFNLPPFDFALRVAAFPFRLAFNKPQPVYYPKELLPSRFVGFASGYSWQNLSEDFLALTVNPQHFDPFVGALLGHLVTGDSTTRVVSTSQFLEPARSPYVQAVFYIGDRFVSENLLRHSVSEVALEAQFTNIAPFRYSARISFWEYAGSIRYNLARGSLQPFVKAGYGLSWYRLEQAEANGTPFTPPNSDWVRKPSVVPLDNLLPNTWHVGGGLEFRILDAGGPLPGGFDFSARADYSLYAHNLGVDLSALPLDRLGLAFATLGDVPGSETVTRGAVTVGLTVGF